MWEQQSYAVTRIEEDAQWIHCLVKGIGTDVECYLTVIYGFNTVEQRKSLWDYPEKKAQSIVNPWIICGDFNALLYPQDRLSSKPVQYADIRDFSNCMHSTLLNELPWKGDYYTWNNKQQGNEMVCSRLDKALGNSEWMMKWGHVILEYELPNISDHAPMIPKSTVDLNLLFKIRGKFERLHKKLNNEEFRNIAQRVAIARRNLAEVQQQIKIQYNDTLQMKEDDALKKLEKWSMIEVNIMKQKSRAKWIKLGDSNTKYFSAVMKERSQRKQITQLTSLEGIQLFDQGAIREEVVKFYKGLMGSSTQNLPAINTTVMKRGAVLSQEQRVHLCSPITEIEIAHCLESIDDKSPGIDKFVCDPPFGPITAF
ncbi:hypothetical protein KY285_005465 [Solanum tuberosum]|nr:hypothetical protein KY285_005465 [Solanum tuberosum]